MTPAVRLYHNSFVIPRRSHQCSVRPYIIIIILYFYTFTYCMSLEFNFFNQFSVIKRLCFTFRIYSLFLYLNVFVFKCITSFSIIYTHFCVGNFVYCLCMFICLSICTEMIIRPFMLCPDFNFVQNV